MNRPLSTLLLVSALGALGAFAPTTAGAAQVYLREADAPHAIFPASMSASRATLELSDSELGSLSKAIGRKVQVRSYPYIEVRGENGILGRIFLLEVVGQSLPIEFAVGVAASGAIQDIQVMAYREPQGDAIQEERFRRQFVGKRLTDPIALGKDIDVISGASISAQSATYAARKGLALDHALRARTGESGH
jgi:Na+-translocating ferredoxin:NAD+ oxidoreductase RnfG subunit